jgi:hypothetical protein
VVGLRLDTAIIAEPTRPMPSSDCPSASDCGAGPHEDDDPELYLF